MQQFWKYKSDNYDKIIFFKLGKFYELFYEDAYIGNKYLDLNWMGRKMYLNMIYLGILVSQKKLYINIRLYY